MFALLVSAALAVPALEEDMACMLLQVTRSIPANGATNVPIDADISLVLEGNCGGAGTWDLEILDSSSTVIATATWTWDGSVPALAQFDLDEDLPADATLLLRAISGDPYGYYGAFEASFDTGSGTLQPLTGALAGEITEATWFRQSQSASVSVVVDAMADPNGLSLIRITGGPGSIVYIDAADAAVLEPGLSWFEEAEPTELCVDIVQIDGSGAESAPVTTCAEPEIVRGDDGGGGGGRGCFGGSGDTVVVSSETEPAGAMLLFGGLFLLRRRTRR